MKLSIYDMSIPSFTAMLGNLSGFLDKGAEHARATGLEPDTLVEARLAPDMLPLRFQVQTACDHAKNAAARLMGVPPVVFEDNETSIEALKARIAKTVGYLEGLSPAAFEGAENRKITVKMPQGNVLEADGLQMLRDWTLPNFYFHVTTAYAILRNQGGALSKRDYMRHAGVYIHAAEAGA